MIQYPVVSNISSDLGLALETLFTFSLAPVAHMPVSLAQYFMGDKSSKFFRQSSKV